MSKKDTLRIPDYINHMIEALNRIFEYTDNIDEAEFVSNSLMQDAVVRNLEVLGEAARNLERWHIEFTNQHSNIPWGDIYYMRNRLSHGYFSIDFEIVWKTVQQDLPVLYQNLKKISGI